MFQDIYSGSPQMHQLTIMYCFEHANNDKITIFFLLKSLQTLFAGV